jgi:hypothetical protein
MVAVSIWKLITYKWVWIQSDPKVGHKCGNHHGIHIVTIDYG